MQMMTCRTQLRLNRPTSPKALSLRPLNNPRWGGIHRLYRWHIHLVSTRDISFRINPEDFHFNTGAIKIHSNSVSMRSLAALLPNVFNVCSGLFPQLSLERINEIQKVISISNGYSLSPIRLIQADKSSVNRDNFKYDASSILKTGYPAKFLKLPIVGGDDSRLFEVRMSDSDRVVLITLAVLLSYILNCSYKPFTHTCCYHGVTPLRSQLESYYNKICVSNVGVLYHIYFTKSPNTLNHDLLLNMLKSVVMDRSIYNLIFNILSVPMIDENGVILNAITECGLPPYDLITTLLLDLYLTQLDIEYLRRYPTHNYVRNCNEVFISIPSNEELINDASLSSVGQYVEYMTSFLNGLGLVYAPHFLSSVNEGCIEGELATLYLDKKGLVTCKPKYTDIHQLNGLFVIKDV